MGQASKPLEVAEPEVLEARPKVQEADLEALIEVAEPSNFFWNLKPADIIHWVRSHRPEIALIAGMSFTTLAISGAALSVLVSPNLGQTITYKPLIDEATLAASRRVSLGEQLLGQVARVLEIEIIETQGPDIGHRSRSVPAMTIVAQADQAAPMPEADLTVGLKAMVIAAGVGLGVTGLMRLLPFLPPLPPLGKQRRQPLSQRLKTSGEVIHPLDHPLATPGLAPRGRSTQTLMPGAMTALPLSEHSVNSHSSHHIPPGTAHQEKRAASEPKRRLRPSQRGRRGAPVRQAQRLIKAVNPVQARTRSKTHGLLRESSEPNRQSASGKPTHQSPKPSNQPTSFVRLDVFPGASKAPQPSPAGSRSVLLPNASPAKARTQTTSLGPTNLSLEMLAELDIRRQYPLSDRR